MYYRRNSDAQFREAEREFGSEPSYENLYQLNLFRARNNVEPKMPDWWFTRFMGDLAGIITGDDRFRYTYQPESHKLFKEGVLSREDLPLDFFYNAAISGTFRGHHVKIQQQTGLGYLSWRVTFHYHPEFKGPGSLFMGLCNQERYGNPFYTLDYHYGSGGWNLITRGLDVERADIHLLQPFFYDPIFYLDFMADQFEFWQELIAGYRANR